MKDSDHRVGIRNLRLEASLACQLKCPSCPTASGKVHAHLGKGFLRVEDFERLLDRNPGVKSIELSNYGEAFLNPQLLDLLRIAAERGVELNCDNGANLNTVRDDVLEGVVKYGLRNLTCSIDGASQETYVQYRKGGNFDTVIANIRKINAYKAQYGTEYPKLVWQFVLFGHNEHEIGRAKALADELDMTFFPKVSWDEDFSPVRDAAKVKRETGLKAVSRSECLEVTHTGYAGHVCDELWSRPQINFDGTVTGCCVNHWNPFDGNAFGDLDAALNGERIRYARAMLTMQAPPRDDIACTNCRHYAERLKSLRFIRKDEFWLPWTQRLMLTAALCGGSPQADSRAISAWYTWKSEVRDWTGLDTASVRLLGLLHANLTRLGIDDPKLAEMKVWRRRTWSTNQHLLHVLNGVLERFDAEGIDTLLLKGAVLAHVYYDDAGSRPMADSDIMVRVRDWGRAMTVLKAEGWVPEHDIDDPVRGGCPSVPLRKDGLELDLHCSPVHECVIPEMLEPFWDAAITVDVQGKSRLTQGPADQLLHCLAHGVRANPVLPGRCVADAVMILRRHEDLDWDRLIAMSSRLGLNMPVLAGLGVVADIRPDLVPGWVKDRLGIGKPSLLQRLEWFGRRRLRMAWKTMRLGALVRRLRSLPRGRRLILLPSLVRDYLGGDGFISTLGIGVSKGTKAVMDLIFPNR